MQKARGKFRLMKAESTQRLRALSKKIGSRLISKARPYYDLLAQSQKVHMPKIHVHLLLIDVIALAI